MAAEEKMKAGMSRADALRAVRLERGNLEVTKEVVRSAGWESLVETCWQDLRFGLRMLLKHPGFTALTVMTLALGIGANTAVFTVVNGVLLRPMPFPQADRLFLVSLTPRGGPFDWQPGVSDGDYLAFRDQDQVFANVASFTTGTKANLTGSGDPVQIPVAYERRSFLPRFGQMQKLVEPFLRVRVNRGTTISLCSATNSGKVDLARTLKF
jgi:hypothetical protein